MERVKFGMIGCGGPLFFHTFYAEQSSIIEYTAMYDIDYERACEMAEICTWANMKPYRELDDMLASDIDAVIIAIPHYQHEEMVEKCADAGKHVLCEKPMAITVEGCKRMIEAAKRNNVKLMIAENHRFLPAHNWIHDAIAKGLIGDINLVRTYEGCNENPAMDTPNFWKYEIQTAGGGCFMDMGVHKFAALEYMLSDRVETVMTHVSKQVATLEEKGEDNAISIVTFESGIMAEVSVSSTQENNAYNSIEIYGTKGTILENHDSEEPVRIFSLADEAGENMGEWYTPEIEHGPNPTYYFISGHYEDEHFAQCILEDREPDFTPEQAMSAVECVLTGYLSFIEQRPARREEVLKLAETGNTKSIIDRLEGRIPTKNKV